MHTECFLRTLALFIEVIIKVIKHLDFNWPAPVG